MAAEGVYSPLDSSREEIRLLEITSITPHITCTLHTVSLQDDPPFCALSYLWGDPTGTEPVTIQGVEMLVTKSLRTSLEWSMLHWRKMFPERDPAECRLWADALCINQKDLTEKSFQIPLMEPIYSASEVTFCCLDAWAPEKETILAIKILSALAQGAVASGFDARSDEYQEANVDWLSDDPFILEHGTDPGAAVALASLQVFGELNYWTRVWVHQELVLSKLALLIFESHSISIIDLMLVGDWGAVAGKAIKPDVINNKFWKKLEYMSLVGSLFYVKLSQQGKKLVDDSKSLEVSDQGFNMFMTVLGCATLAATDPKDHVYGLLGVAGLKIKPDYSPSRSLTSVYIEFCIECLRGARPSIETAFQETGMPSYVAAMCPLLFLRPAGLINRHPGDKDYGLPSWVPNFPSISSAHPVFELPDMAARHTEDLTKYRGLIREIDWYCGISIKGESLRVPILDIANLEQMTEPVTMASGTWPAFTSSLFDMIGQFPRGAQHRHPLLRLADVFFTDHEGNLEVWNSPEVMRLIRVLQYLLYPALDLDQLWSEGGQDAVGDAFKLNSDAAFGPSFLDKVGLDGEWVAEVLGGPPEGHLPETDADAQFDAEELEKNRRDIVAFLADIATDFITAAESTNEDIQHVNRNVRNMVLSRTRIARTEDDDFAIVPECVEPGDFVAHIFGYQGLSVLREVENHFVLVGPCRVSTRLSQLLGAVYAGDREFEIFEFR